MRRQRYDDPYRDRWDYERAVLRPDWGRAHPDDPNWRDGQYHGMRTGGGSWQARYGQHRMEHRADLGGWGGYAGRYDLPVGGFDDAGLLGMVGRRASDRHPRRSPPEGVRMDPGWQDGGVGGGYLRHFDTRGPRYSPEPGWRDQGRGRYPDPGPLREREYGGYNTGGWAPDGGVGPGTRSDRPNR